MRWRVASSGAHSVSRRTRVASFGLSSAFSVGFGQSLPHSMRCGASLTNACASLVESAQVGGPTLESM
jgi:hypothetical protein